MDAYFGLIKTVAGGHFKVDRDEPVKIMALACHHRDAHAFPEEWDPSRVLKLNAEGKSQKVCRYYSADGILHPWGLKGKGKMSCRPHLSLS